MRTVFADATYWIALLNPHDQLHNRAIEISSRLGSCRVVTSERTLSELLNGLSGRGSLLREKAIQTVKSISNNPNVEVVPQTSHQFHRALDRYFSAADKEWGITDCSSFDIMEEKRISEALTYDHHFEQAGFKALLRDGRSQP
jgi:uncharacterized protein